MELIAFETKYGRKVIGGKYGGLIRSASNTQELTCPLCQVPKELVEKAERLHEIAINKHLQEWNLPNAQN